MINELLQNEKNALQYHLVDNLTAAEEAFNSNAIKEAARLLLQVPICDTEKAILFFNVVRALLENGIENDALIEKICEDLFDQQELIKGFVSDCADAGHLEALISPLLSMKAGVVKNRFCDLIAERLSEEEIQQAVLKCIEKRDFISAMNFVLKIKNHSAKTVASIIIILVNEKETSLAVQLLHSAKEDWEDPAIKEAAKKLHIALPEHEPARKFVSKVENYERSLLAHSLSKSSKLASAEQLSDIIYSTSEENLV